MPRPARSPRLASLPPCISTGRRTNPSRSRTQSAPSRQSIWQWSRRWREEAASSPARQGCAARCRSADPCCSAALCCRHGDIGKFLLGSARANESPVLIFSITQGALGLASGSLVGFSLGLIGGGGSILAVPLMFYLVGVPDAHVAIGTSAIAVGATAAANLVQHARRGTVKWHCAGVFAAAGVAGALAGSSLSKMVDGQRLLVGFALLMFVVGASMLRRRQSTGDDAVQLSRQNFSKLLLLGFF